MADNHPLTNIDTDKDTDVSADDPARVDEVTQLRRFKAWWRADAEHRYKWVKECDMDFAFVACEQWSDTDKKAMEDNGRVPVVFNRVLTVIKSICGSEINGRQVTRFAPRGVEDTKVNETLTAASEWMSDQCDAEDEQSEAFEGSVICGEGWTEARWSLDEGPEGSYVEEEIDPREMYPDAKSRKKNYSDARRISRLKCISLTDAKAMFPDAEEDDLDASWAEITSEGDKSDPRPVEDKTHQEMAQDVVASDKTDVRILHMQWWEREPYYLVAMEQDPSVPQLGQPQPEPEELSAEEFKAFKKRAKDLGIKYQSVKLTKKVFKQAFIGNKILDMGPAPCPYKFSFNCITGERDRKNGHFFGMVRMMRDPQMWANKMLANALHIANTTAKGGIIAEKDAFDSQRQAEESYAQPNEITWAAENAVKDGRIMPKPGTGDPSVYVKLLEFAIASIRDVTGVNLELLGLRDANQPGILEAQRKQAAMTVLASIFNSLRHFRKSVGAIRLHFIQEFMSDGRLIRIKGDHGGQPDQLVPLTRDKTLGEYDVIISEAPTSPNQKEQTWALIQNVLPTFQDMLTPDVVLSLLEYSPFPSEIVEKLRALKMQAEQAQAPQQQAAQQQQAALTQGQIDRLKAQAQKDQATAAKTMAEAQTVGSDLQSEQAQGMAKAAHEQIKAQVTAQKAQADIEATRQRSALEMAKAQDERQMAHESHMAERQDREYQRAADHEDRQFQRSQAAEGQAVDQHVKMRASEDAGRINEAKVAQMVQQSQQQMMQQMMDMIDQRFQQAMAMRQQGAAEQQSAGEMALKRSQADKLKPKEKKS